MQQILDLLQNKPIYHNIETEEIYNSDMLLGQTLDLFCENEQSFKTFELGLAKGYHNRVDNALLKHQPEDYENHEGLFSFINHVKAECLSCKKYNYHYLLNFHSNKAVRKNANYDEDRKHFLQKVGQFPKESIKVDPLLNGYLSSEKIKLYEKGLMNLKNGYGIGSFAYFRNVLESEIHNLLTLISKVNEKMQVEIGNLMKKYSERKQMSALIEEVYKYLPASLKSLGHNPVKLLYDNLSIGMHGGFTEEECLTKAILINDVLVFVLKKIKEEKLEIQKIKESIKKLDK